MKLVSGLALFSAFLLRGRQRDTGLLASDMVMKTARWSYFWVVRQENAFKGLGGRDKDETDPVKA